MKRVQVHVPGKIMLAGEYSVLNGGRALSTTVDKYLSVSVETTGPKPGATIFSNLWTSPRHFEIGERETSFESSPLEQTARYGLRDYSPAGSITIKVKSDLNVKFGMGSSSAIRLGTLLALEAIKSDKTNRWDTANRAFELQKGSQTLASGYDIATQLHGGLISFKRSEKQTDLNSGVVPKQNIDSLSKLVHIFVGGKGAPTKTVTTDTLKWLSETGRMQQFRTASEDLVTLFENALTEPDNEQAKSKLFASIKRHREFINKGPHFPASISNCLDTVSGVDERWSYKTTGAGGEDAIILVGLEEDIVEAREELSKIGWSSFNGSFCNNGATVELQEVHDD